MKTPMTKLMLAAVAALSICLGARAAITTEGLVAYYPFDGDKLGGYRVRHGCHSKLPQ